MNEKHKSYDSYDSRFYDGANIYLKYDGDYVDVYINSFIEVDTQEALIDFAGILNHGEYEQLVNEDRLSAYVEEHEEEIASRLGDSYVFLGHEGDSWYFLQ